MANDENLLGHGFDEISAKEHREIASKGGKASVESRRKKKMLKECLSALLEQDIVDKKSGKTVSGAEAMAVAAMKAALKGDWRAWELVRDTSGQKPVDKVMVAEVDQSIIDEVEQIVSEIKNG